MAKMSTFADNFNDNFLDTVKWVPFGNPAPLSERVREVNGRIELTPRSGETGQYSGFESSTTYDLTDSYAHVELVQTPRSNDDAVAIFVASIDSNNSVSFNVAGGFLRCFQNVSGTRTRLVKVPYDPAAHQRGWGALPALTLSRSSPPPRA